MTDPDRWRDPRAGAPSEARALLRAARPSRPMSDRERARSAMRIDRLAALPVAAGVWVWWKGVAVAAAALSGVALVTQLVPAAPAPPRLAAAVSGPARAPAPARPARPELAPPGPTPAEASPAAAAHGGPSPLPRAEAPPSPAVALPLPQGAAWPAAARAPLAAADPPPAAARAPLAADPSPPPAPPEAAGSAAPPAGGPGGAALPSDAPGSAASPALAPDPGDSLTREVALLEAARRALGADPAGALGKLDEHAASFPRGKLGVEREFLAVDALRRLGRTAEARARGEALLRRSRGSLYEERVKKMLDAMP